eukprot:TRINITY_DN3165_c0_g1_i3.p1 TRINITY_DN3165_c0_g1~~TRINITY_DN3165_c0_g1_i3.p1  ORF type:complete len:744 (+),score=182.24 TRINITY_DN3165_c0_g1_i3:1157-3388(+)
MLCPVTCGQCTQWKTAAVAGQLISLGISTSGTAFSQAPAIPQTPTPATAAPVTTPVPAGVAPDCKDDSSGFVAQGGKTCADLQSVCSLELHSFEASVPAGVYGWMLCPMTCAKCNDWQAAVVAGDLQIIGVYPCRDSSAMPVTAVHTTCSAFDTTTCNKDVSTEDPNIPPGTMGWHLCPGTCAKCTEWNAAATAAPARPTLAPLQCVDDYPGRMSSLGVTCADVRDQCNEDINKFETNRPAGDYMWMLCPVSCGKCDEWSTKVASDDLKHLGITTNPMQCVDDIMLLTVASGGCAAVAGKCQDDFSQTFKLSNPLYGWMLCPVTCGKCVDYTHVVEQGKLEQIGLKASAAPVVLPHYGWMSCPVTCNRCGDWQVMAANGSLKYIGIDINPADIPTPIPTMACTDNAKGWLSAGCSGVISMCDLDVSKFSATLPPGTYGWMVCPVTCNSCDRWSNALASGDLIDLGIYDPNVQTMSPSGGNFTAKFSLYLKPAEGDYLFLAATLISVWWGSWMNAKWSGIRFRETGGGKTGLSSVGVVGVVVGSVVGFGLTFAGLYLTDYEWNLEGVIGVLADETKKKGSMFDLAKLLVDDGDGRVVVGLTLWIFVIAIPLLLPVLTLAAAVTSLPILTKITKILHPFAMADVVALSILITDQEVDKVLSKGILGDFDCLTVDVSAFISLSSTTSIGTPLLILGVVIVNIATFTVTLCCPDEDSMAVMPIDIDDEQHMQVYGEPDVASDTTREV